MARYLKRIDEAVSEAKELAQGSPISLLSLLLILEFSLNMFHYCSLSLSLCHAHANTKKFLLVLTFFLFLSLSIFTWFHFPFWSQMPWQTLFAKCSYHHVHCIRANLLIPCCPCLLGCTFSYSLTNMGDMVTVSHLTVLTAINIQNLVFLVDWLWSCYFICVVYSTQIKYDL